MTQPVGFVDYPPRRVLVVDDDADFAESLSDLLAPHGFDVRTAQGGREAVGTLSSFAADLALVDVKLGTESGLRLVPQLKGRRPAITCILMTAYAALDSAVEAVSSGAEDYLLKPLEPMDVIEKVRRIFVRNEELRRRELEQRLILLGNVCAGIAHDVNGCLQTMLNDVGDIDAALATSPPGVESARVSAASLGDRVRVASDACRRILTFARGATSTHGCDASAALRECTLALERVLPATVTLSIRIPDEELRVPLDPAQFQQIVVNLTVNAIHAIEDRGTVRIDLDTVGADAGRRVRLSVTDDGRGIPESALPSIFDPYFSTKPPGEAAGLGLSVVHGLVRSGGGQVHVESAIGHGSRFEVLLPLEEPLSVPEPDRPPPARATKPKRVLIVDDLQPILMAMDKRFKMAGYTPLCASSAEQATPLLEEHGDDLAAVISDVRLPGISGLAFAERIRGQWPSLPIILISGDSGNLPGLKELGSRTALLHKPFELADLLSCFERLTSTR